MGDFMNVLDCGNGIAVATEDQKWCCSARGGQSCCGNSMQIAFGRPYSPSGSSSSSSRSTAASATAITAMSSLSSTGTAGCSVTSSPAAPTPATRGSGSDAETIGIAAGVSGGVALFSLATIVFFMLKERKKRVAAEKRLESMIASGQPQHAQILTPGRDDVPSVHVHGASSQSRYEVQG